MTPDFPAAHSMDTVWFAVDDAGHVAAFDTGENGHMPQQATDENLLFDLQRLRHPDQDEEDFWNSDREATAAGLGVFYFNYDEELETAAAYHRDNAPEMPLHVDQLPPAMRERCKRIHFQGVDFARDKFVQPIEHGECVFWYDGWVAYLAGDGKTVRPRPGKEGDFPAFCQEFRKHFPKEAARLTFEGVPAEEKTPRRKPKRKDPSDGS